ncbi:MAG: sensor histidine kinase [Solirubrobacteraceae bacterium]
MTLAIAGILTLVLLGTFVAVYRDTGTQVRAQADQDLRSNMRSLSRGVRRGSSLTPQSVEQAARTYVGHQPSFGASARLYVVRVAGRRTITNEGEVLGLVQDPSREHDPPGAQRIEAAEGRSLLAAPPGLHTFPLFDAGPVRVLVMPMAVAGRQLATLAVGEGLDVVHRAQEGVRRAFLLAGALALAAAILAGHLVTGRLSRPLRRIASTARQIDAGELDHRIRERGPHDEVRVLADALDHMLDRLQGAFDRQRAFVGDASHELRTPLTVIAGQIEVLESQHDPGREEVARVVGVVGVEVARMTRLIDDLLLLANADEGRLLRRRRFDLVRFLCALFEGLSQLGDRRYEHSEIPRGTIDADPDRLAQVLRNVARNAVQQTGAGGLVRLTITADQDRLSFAVDDDGPGIPVAERERVFDRFHRIDASRARAYGGSGLGLAIAQAIIREHGGRIWVDQAPAGGARVAFELTGFEPTLSAAPVPASPAPG